MNSICRRSRGSIAAGVIAMLALAGPLFVGRALAVGPVIPYTDPEQLSDSPPTAWLLMAPPTTASGLGVDAQAGLANWITYGRYNTLKDCSATVQLVRNGASTALPQQMSGAAIGTIPGAMPGYQAPMPGYPTQAGPPIGQPGYPGMQPAYPGMQPGYSGMQPPYPATPPAYPAAPPPYPGMQPSYAGPQGYSGAQPGYASNLPGAQNPIQQPAQYMTRQQADAAYCFADNDRRLQGLIAPPAPVTPPGQQPLNEMPAQTFPGVGQ